MSGATSGDVTGLTVGQIAVFMEGVRAGQRAASEPTKLSAVRQ